MRTYALCFALLAALAQLAAQGEDSAIVDSEPTFTLDVKVVNILATVRDRGGRLVSTLGKDDFILSEDGVRQEIRYFDHETDLPLTMGLLIDTSGSQKNLIFEERSAGGLFLRSVLRPDKDLGFLMSFDRNVELLQDFTSSMRLLQRGLDDLHVEVPMGGVHPNPTGTKKQTSTALYDAVFLAADEMFRNQVGRKAVIVISDGFDVGSKVNLKGAIEAAQRSDVVVYTIQYLDRHFAAYGYMAPATGTGALKRMARETGGSFFSIYRSRSLGAIFQQIEDEMRSQYSIGYSPKRELAGSSFRKINLKSTRKGVKIQARDGYYPDAI